MWLKSGLIRARSTFIEPLIISLILHVKEELGSDDVPASQSLNSN